MQVTAVLVQNFEPLCGYLVVPAAGRSRRVPNVVALPGVAGCTFAGRLACVLRFVSARTSLE